MGAITELEEKNCLETAASLAVAVTQKPAPIGRRMLKEDTLNTLGECGDVVWILYSNINDVGDRLSLFLFPDPSLRITCGSGLQLPDTVYLL